MVDEGLEESEEEESKDMLKDRIGRCYMAVIASALTLCPSHSTI